MSQLRQGWEIKKFTDVFDINGGTQPPKSEFISEPKEGYIRLLQIRDFGAKPVPTYIPDNGKRRTCTEEDILIGRYGASVGRICTGMSGAYNVALAKVAKPDYIDTGYLKYFLKSDLFQRPLSMLSRSAQNGFNKKDLSTFDFYQPPLEDQKRIADKLDSVLAKVETAQARLDKIPTILKRFRQSVLAAATSGELTKDWREGNERSRIEESTWSIKDVPGSWNVKFLPEVASSRLGKMLDKNKNTGLATKYLGNINLRWHRFELGDLKEILVSQKEQEELNIQDGDLLLCEGGEPGRGAVWNGGKTDIVFQKALHRVRCKDELNPDFLLFCIEDDYFSKKLSLLYTGTTIKHLTGKALKKYPVRVPPLQEQLEIVNRVSALLEHGNTVEKQYNAAKMRLDKLTQSILAKAFRGELTK